MSHNRTQPEEIDHILRAMGSHDDMDADKHSQVGAASDGTVRDAERDEFRSVSSLSCAENQRRHMRNLMP